MARYFVDEGYRPTLFGYTDTPLDPEQPGRSDLTPLPDALRGQV